MELNRLVFSFFNAEVASRYWLDIVHGMWVTTYLGVAVIAAGLGAGLALAMARSFQFKPASFLIVVFADVFRALPPLDSIDRRAFRNRRGDPGPPGRGDPSDPRHPSRRRRRSRR